MIAERGKTVNVVCLGTKHSYRHRFLTTLCGDEEPLAPLYSNIEIDGIPYVVNLETPISVCWGVNDQCYMRSQGFIFVYNPSKRSSFEQFLSFRETIMRVKGQERFPWIVVSYVQNTETIEVESEEGRRLAEHFGCIFQEIHRDDKDAILSSITNLVDAIIGFESGFMKTRVDPVCRTNETRRTEMCVAVLGDIFVGKTSIIRKLLTNEFCLRYTTTVDKIVHKWKVTVDNQKFLLRIVDNPSDVIDNLRKDSFVGIQAFVLVYSVTSRESFNKIAEIKEAISNNKQNNSRLPIILVANKKEEHLFRQVFEEEGKELAIRLKAAYFDEISTKDEDVRKVFIESLKAIRGIYEQESVTDSIGQFSKAGILQKQKGKKWLSQVFTIKEGDFTYSQDNNTKVCGCMVLSYDTRVAIFDHDKGYGFTVSVNGASWTLLASSLTERNEWLAVIRLNVACDQAAESLIEEVIQGLISETQGTVLPSGFIPSSARSPSSSSSSSSSSTRFKVSPIIQNKSNKSTISSTIKTSPTKPTNRTTRTNPTSK